MSRKKLGIVIIVFILITGVFFLPVFTKRQVPLPLNLLVSFYSPWRYEGYKAPNKPIGFDDIRQMLPYMQFTKESLAKKEIPLWNPYIFAGNPHIASLQPAFFYPSTVLTMLLPLVDAWTILILLQPILAGVFTYLFLKRLNFSDSAAFLGAVCFAFSGWMITWWEEFLIVVHSILWLPLALYASLLIWDKQKLGFILLTLAVVLSIFAGFTQSTLYLLVTVVTWNIWLWHKAQDRGPLVILFASAIAVILITAVQWLPTAEVYLLSRRLSENSAYLFSGNLLPLTRLITLFAPDYWGNPGTYNAFGFSGFYQERMIYLGLVPLFLALVAYVSTHRSDASFWKWFTAITFSMTLAIPTSWIWHTLHIPLLSAMQPVRIMMVTAFGASVLTAYGYETLIAKKQLRLLVAPIAIIAVIALAGWAWLAHALLSTKYCLKFHITSSLVCPSVTKNVLNELSAYGTITLRNMLLPTASFIALVIVSLLFVRKKTLLFVAYLFLHLGTMWYFANKYLYFSDRNNMYPVSSVIQALKNRVGYNRVWSYGNASVETNMLSFFDLATPEGYAPFFSREFGELAGTIGTNGTISPNIPRSDVTLKHMGEDEIMSSNPYRLRLMSLLGVRYVMETKNGEKKDVLKPEVRFPPSLFTLAWENENWRLWEYKNALPRTFLASDIRVTEKPSDVSRILFDLSTDVSKTLIVDSKPAISFNRPASTASAAITSYTPNDVTIHTSADSPAMLFLSDSYYPGWYAAVDGKKTKIYKADYAFRAIEVPAGNHTVVFTYRPVSFEAGIILSALGLLSVCFFTFRGKAGGLSDN